MSKDRVLMTSAAALAVVLAAYLWWQRPPGPATVAAGGPPALPGGNWDVPRIGLDRLAQRPAGALVGRRDVFDFGATPTLAPAPSTPPPATAPPVTVAPAPAGPPPPPPVNVKYIGSVEARQGPRVAFFLTDQKEVLTGQVGQTVMNRFKVVRIGYESVDLQDLGSGQLRRLPLRGN